MPWAPCWASPSAKVRVQTATMSPFGCLEGTVIAMMFEHADGEPVLVLSEDQCWKLLQGTQHGRLVSVVAGRAEIFPVNVAAQDRTLVIRTNPGTKLATMAVNNEVVFEADGILSDQAWSVVVRGTARLLETSAEISA